MIVKQKMKTITDLAKAVSVFYCPASGYLSREKDSHVLPDRGFLFHNSPIPAALANPQSVSWHGLRGGGFCSFLNEHMLILQPMPISPFPGSRAVSLLLVLYRIFYFSIFQLLYV